VVVEAEADGEAEGEGVVVLVEGSQTLRPLSLYKDSRQAAPQTSDLSPAHGVIHCVSGMTDPPLPWNSFPQ